MSGQDKFKTYTCTPYLISGIEITMNQINAFKVCKTKGSR